MPAIKRTLTAASANALTGLQFAEQPSATAVSLWATTVTAGEVCSFSVGDRTFLEDAVANTGTAQIVDTAKDQLLFREIVPGGAFRLAVPAVVATFAYLINIETA